MSTSRIVTITDPDEAVRLCRAGLLVFNAGFGKAEPLWSNWDEPFIKQAVEDGVKLFAMLIEEDDSLTEE